MEAELAAKDEAEGRDADLLVAAIVHDDVEGTAWVTLLKFKIWDPSWLKLSVSLAPNRATRWLDSF